MDEIIVRGPQPLSGEVEAAGSKNAVLPALFATLLTSQRCVLRNVPRLADVTTACRLLERLGARVESIDEGRGLCVDPSGAGAERLAELPAEESHRATRWYLVEACPRGSRPPAPKKTS